MTGPATGPPAPATLADGDARRHRSPARAPPRRRARGVMFVRESGPSPPDGYARAVTPLWGSSEFFRAVGVLQAPWAAEVRAGPFLPCVTARSTRPHALAVAPR